ncbi:N-acetylmuramoyl-L-alanine amidase CwlD [Heyndrickxia oleronia]|jgi:N-acetylmuramoyl-L-alanine amidase|uniref:N-acetylmuramoyl-L-alanine amidase CwlD n=1 Tax=Heyndrickxia oleronia TaxID=38875 RepID=A0A8E2LGA8_9BACI|nr:N-acetylmuramoyl-L-alanine amidase CwlD [Heyndrickxia oleronia]NYV68243.1 N-acetylmuramoyl-L-alanine amidase CwlD [Bacillus sp. Gen3]MBU5214673.1 N-acetylmuramoyl-L-alanine amidase CwlD [Heyndrickxia oleronia]MCM3240941.1 N-acetylmuramoyl-L-alanine amidase CwlD [Heyndrickxia oleronia]MCM3456703.1 N-acetylmuramoyl-L-alanine amidase CwlD [Heyndrickxia oleronia]MDH5163806.1 N-acetylmuramoyl-L-alanine amidase CwlD [Heyndrickxia oleronia]
MKRKIKVISFILGALLLFLLFQFQFFQRDTWESWNLPLSGKVIILDPGHGGPDGGAGDEDALEKDIALSISKKIKEYLQEQGALVMMTREDDSDLADPETKGISRRKVEDLRTRLDMINESEADLYLSIHLNSIPSPRWSGAQTFYSPHLIENKRLAKFIQSELIRNLENTDREAKLLKNIYIVKNAKKPGALVEVGFLSNPTERENLKSDKYQEKVSASIYNGIMRYFSNEKDLK